MCANITAFSIRLIFVFVLSACQTAFAASRTYPPSGALVVRSGTTNPGEFNTVTSAVNSLPNDGSSRSIFIYPGTYNEQVNITRSGPLTISGYTMDTMKYSENQVTIQAGVSLAQAGSNDGSATFRVHKNDFKMYNVNVTNTFGKGSQASALSQYGSRVGLYACAFRGYQDTLYANVGTQVYLKNHIEGAVDFVFGRLGQAFFGGNTIAVSDAGCITANGRSSNDAGSYVFDQNTIVLAPGAASGASNKIFFGRPWGAFAKVIFKNTVVTAPLNYTIWSVWNLGDERISNVLFADYNSTGSGMRGAHRAKFAHVLTASQAANYNISSAVGNDFASWVDLSYL
ncbi:pectinesterase [Tricholoma matsutake]|nr:pectinesterase [Tricholoma matsutake 945]